MLSYFHVSLCSILLFLHYQWDSCAALSEAEARLEDPETLSEMTHLKTWSSRKEIVILDPDNPWEVWMKNPIPKDRHGISLYLIWFEDELAHYHGPSNDGWIIHLKQLVMILDVHPELDIFVELRAASIIKSVLNPSWSSSYSVEKKADVFTSMYEMYKESMEQILDESTNTTTLENQMQAWLSFAETREDKGGEMAYVLAEYIYFDARMDRLSHDATRVNFTTAATLLSRAVKSSNTHAKVLLAILHFAELWPLNYEDDTKLVRMSDSLAMLYLFEGSESRNTTTTLLSNLVLGLQYFKTGRTKNDYPTDDCKLTLGHWSEAASVIIDRMTESKNREVTGDRSKDLVYLVNEQELGQQRESEKQEEDEDTMVYYESILKNSDTHPDAPDVATRMGEMHLFGAPQLNMPPDVNEALVYFQQAAALGQAQASAYLGLLYANGLVGEGPDPVLAQEHFERGAEQNNGLANFGLGHMYLEGKEVEQNVTKAIEYLKKSADVGHSEAYNHLAVVYLNGMGELSQNQTQAFEYFQRSADAGSVQSLYNLAVMTLNGWGTNQSCPIASNQLRKVALSGIYSSREELPFSVTRAHSLYQQGQIHRALIQYAVMGQLGNSIAMCNLAYILEHHDLSRSVIHEHLPTLDAQDPPPTRQAAFELYEVASFLDDPVASRKLGKCFAEGWPGVCEQDVPHALEHYAEAAARGDVFSMYTAGTIYASSSSDSRDLERAKESFEQCTTTLVFPENIPCQLYLWWVKLLELYYGWWVRS